MKYWDYSLSWLQPLRALLSPEHCLLCSCNPLKRQTKTFKPFLARNFWSCRRVKLKERTRKACWESWINITLPSSALLVAPWHHCSIRSYPESCLLKWWRWSVWTVQSNLLRTVKVGLRTIYFLKVNWSQLTCPLYCHSPSKRTDEITTLAPVLGISMNLEYPWEPTCTAAIVWFDRKEIEGCWLSCLRTCVCRGSEEIQGTLTDFAKLKMFLETPNDRPI